MRDQETRRAWTKRYYAEHKERAWQHTLAWRKRNPEKVAAAQHRWYLKHKDKARAHSRKWATNNKEKINAKQRRYLQNPVVRVLFRHRWRINAALKRFQNAFKAGRTVELLGCSAKFYKEFLERLFLPGMTWESRCEWHIDHIIPVSKFDLTTKEGQKAAFHYTNTQPLWKLDNLRKGAQLQVAVT